VSFDASMMVYFGKRIKLNFLNKINQEMVKKGREILDASKGEETPDQKEEEGEKKNREK
jgi:IS5 family transposase